MAVLHRWAFTNATLTANLCAIDGSEFFDQQSASNSGTRNSGGTTASASSPTRATGANAIGGVNYLRLRTLNGDNFISGSGSGYRCDGILNNGTNVNAHEGYTRVYRYTVLLRKNVDFFPVAGNWNTVGPEFHHNLGGWPGGVGWSLQYCGADPASPFNQANVSAGSKVQSGDLYVDMFGGTVPTANFSPTPNTICYEKWPFLKAGTWEGKALDIAFKIYWASNAAEASGTAYYYKDVHAGTGTPTDLVHSGFIEVQYRLGTVGANATTFGAWTTFDPGTITYAGGGKQVWANGGTTGRHYRPTIFRALDTGQDTTAYLKLANYHDATSSDTSVYVADPTIASDWVDVGLSFPAGSGGGGGSTISNAPGVLHIGVASVDTAGAAPLGDLLNYKRVTPSPAVVPADADNFTVGYEYGAVVAGSGTVNRKMLVYALDGGAGTPGTLIATSNAVAVTATVPDWIAYSFPQASLIPYVGQQIAVGTIMGSANNTFQTYEVDLANAEFLRLDSYSTGPTSSWAASAGGGSTGTYGKQLACCLVYNQTPGGGGSSAPTLQSASFDNDSVNLHFSQGLDPASIPDASAFALARNSDAAIQPPDKVTLAGQDVAFALPFLALSTDTLTVAYTAPTAGKLRDQAGANNVADFAATPVVNNAGPLVRATGTRVTGSRGTGSRVGGHGGGGV